MSELTQQILKANERFVKQSLSQGGFDEVSKVPGMVLRTSSEVVRSLVD